LAGPTASGKTAVALRLAEVIPLEIISVDSALVYRGMDIGTAKPSAAEQALVAHHLIDLIDPRDSYSAAQFVADAQALIGEVRGRGHLPLLVGGTMQYFKALIVGIDALPPADPAVRAALDEQARAQGWPALHAELARVDPVTAARLAPNDAQRVQRALEVWQLTGQTLSSLHSRDSGATLPPADHLLLSLEPTERSWLHQQIGLRFEHMLAKGLVEEVRQLRDRADLHADLPSMRCVGYRQVWEALDAGLHGPALLAAVRDTGTAATRQLAKRQLTWLRSLDCSRIAADQPGVTERALAAVLHSLSPG
jgi:tRNA dimethylallyltransferase